MKILIVEDEEHLAAGLRFNLEAEGYDTSVVDSGESALDLLRDPEDFDLVLLDVMLPQKDGFDVARELRAAGMYLPVLMLTARGRAEDILRGLDSGADDYLTKPFDLDILLARIRGLLRRRRWQGEPAKPASDLFEFGSRVVDFDRQQIRTPSESHSLTLMEANLLRYLVRNEGHAVSRKTLLEEVWGVREDTDTRAIDNFVVRLRRYLEDEPARPKHLLTVRGVGYRFVAKPE